MPGVITKSFDSPDERHTPAGATVEVLLLGSHQVARRTFQPGWRWSEQAPSWAATEHCQERHVGAVQRGALRVTHADGSQADLEAGDAYILEPGHDLWVVGDEPAVVLEFASDALAGRSRTAGIDTRGIPEND